jgi:branched-chain amino acid transport system ATP-binding protein
MTTTVKTITDHILECRGLSPRYGKLEVAHDISFSVRRGELLAVLGPNGAGKTSVMELIAGRVAGSGSVELDGRPIEGLPAYKRVAAGLAFVPENRGLFGDLSVAENLELGALSRKPRTHNLDMIFELFPALKPRLKQAAGTMSGGEQQMLAIGRAIASSPKLLIIDEPTQGLAPIILDQIADALTSLKKTGLSILLIEQSVGFAARIADSYCVISGGKLVVGDGDRADLQNAEKLFERYLGD